MQQQAFTTCLLIPCPPTPTAGDLVFWVKLNKGVCKQMAATRSEAVSAAWSPCGRYVVTSTVAPRLRVDNNVRVFTYYGAPGTGEQASPRLL